MLGVSVLTTPIAPSGGFSVETLTGVTLSWKTELNRSISVMEDGIPGRLQHCHEICCEKGGCHGRRACRVQRWHHRRDIVSRQVDLYMTCRIDCYQAEVCSSIQRSNENDKNTRSGYSGPECHRRYTQEASNKAL